MNDRRVALMRLVTEGRVSHNSTLLPFVVFCSVCPRATVSCCTISLCAVLSFFHAMLEKRQVVPLKMHECFDLYLLLFIVTPLKGSLERVVRG